MKAKQLSGRVKIAIFDDCVIFRAGLTSVLGKIPEFEIVCASDFNTDSAALVGSGVLGVSPDVLLAHTTTKDINEHIEIIGRLRDANASLRILIISEYSDIDYLVKIVASGCDGYVLRSVSEESLRRAISNIAADIFVFDRIVISKFFMAPALDHYIKHSQELSNRETKILDLIAEGQRNNEIAAIFNLSPGTMKNLISDMLHRYKCKNRSQLINLLRSKN
ncbi:MAG: response regulator transcription factor [Synergistaceae bacterium]|nr:response regulator transcription factor [Synergistaceae bacterium]